MSGKINLKFKKLIGGLARTGKNYSFIFQI